jgi:hypothetical protein
VQDESARIVSDDVEEWPVETQSRGFREPRLSGPLRQGQREVARIVEGVVEGPLVVPRLVPIALQKPALAFDRRRVNLPVMRLPDPPLPASGELVDLQNVGEVELVGGAVQSLKVGLTRVEQVVESHPFERLSRVDQGAVLEARDLQLQSSARDERAQEARPGPLPERALDQALFQTSQTVTRS